MVKLKGGNTKSIVFDGLPLQGTVRGSDEQAQAATFRGTGHVAKEMVSELIIAFEKSPTHMARSPANWEEGDHIGNIKIGVKADKPADQIAITDQDALLRVTWSKGSLHVALITFLANGFQKCTSVAPEGITADSIRDGNAEVWMKLPVCNKDMMELHSDFIAETGPNSMKTHMQRLLKEGESLLRQAPPELGW